MTDFHLGPSNDFEREMDAAMSGKVTKITIKHNKPYDEYIVKVWRGRKWDEEASYFTGDKQDALATKRHLEIDYGLLTENPVKRKRKASMPVKTRRRKKTKAQIKATRLKNLAKARRAKAAKARPRRKSTAKRRTVRRRSNYSYTKGGGVPAAAYAESYYTVDGRKRKLTGLEAGALASQGHSVKKWKPRKKPTAKRKTVRKTARKTTRKSSTRKTARRAYSKSSTTKRRWYKVGAAKKLILASTAANYRKKGLKVTITSAPKSKTTTKGAKRKTARKVYRPKSKKRTTKRKVAPKRKRSMASINKERLKNLKKARAAKKKMTTRRRGRPLKKLGKRSVVRRAVRRVKKKRPQYKRSSVRRVASRDYRRKQHKRGKRTVARLTTDVKFEMDFKRAYSRQKLGRSRLRKKVNRLGRHPSHLDKRHTTGGTRRGWKEFAGVTPNTVTYMKQSPVNGTFNGVLVDEIHGKLAHSGQTVVIKPPKNAPLYFIWSSGARTFEIVGKTKALTSLAKGMARAGEPIKITRINYLAATYPSPAGTRRTGREKMHVAYTHKIKHQAYITWNQKSGSRARFPIITKGTRGKSMVNRSGIIL